ncbi:hydroxyacid-oxoacid transhydrogenase [Cryptosporangium aurantiacum]|uniref:hydroxyacid-oxoacid transhydrogenase n=1 Tax=Cryptosporangium aurantiacum TaxID=134849 RepID=A0A1M7MWF8_9ACTN|nr:hydroxyacid-oxoacid transhydrogenase [Cryptosporangium aurantiacum]SHM95506.1 Alcohol dehydrogenase, class IV [Cryptosporangium aurantiacum]
MTDLLTESVFTWGAPPMKYGPGAVDEIGFDVSRLGVRRVLVLTDPRIAATGLAARVGEALKAAGVDHALYDQVHCEPTDDSLRAAVAAATELAGAEDFDGFVAVGGGSVIDTAKAVNLLSTSGGDLMDYVNKPVGGGQAPRKPTKPLIAVPTTAGTGSESTPVCVLDILGLKVKSGISHPSLRPALAVVDPLVTLSLPAAVTAASGMDIVCHALESYTARPYTSFLRHAAEARVAYNGSNPVSDTWAEKSLALIARSFRRAVLVGTDLGARSDMMLAATFAGMGFGNAGVHIPHACAYPIAGMVRDYRPAGYDAEEAMVPHGQSVSLTAPAAFRFTFPTDPERHVRAASLLSGGAPTDAAPADRLPEALVALMRDIGIPSGVAAVGFGSDDVDALVEGTLKQQRLLNVAPREVTAEDLAGIFRSSLENW